MKKMTTYSGRELSIDKPDKDDICLEDIAHALSMICRFNGHCRFFYSVAQHCMNVANVLEGLECSYEIQLYGLLHDAAEAYVCDLPKPVKDCIPGYEAVESAFQNAIWARLGLRKPTEEEYRIIKEADDSVLASEASVLMTNPAPFRLNPSGPDLNIEYKPMDQVENEYLTLEKRLLRLVKHGPPYIKDG